MDSDETGERAERLAEVRRNHAGHLKTHRLDECWEYQDTAFLLAELDRVTAERDRWRATSYSLHPLNVCRERDEAIASRDAWAEKAEKEREEASAEVAAMVNFLECELHWEYFRADGFVGEKHVSASEQNAQVLRAFLVEKGHGLKFLAKHDAALAQVKTLREALLRVCSEASVPGVNGRDLWHIAADALAATKPIGTIENPIDATGVKP